MRYDDIAYSTIHEASLYTQRNRRKLLIIGGAFMSAIAIIVIIILAATLGKKDKFCYDCMAVASDNAACTEIGADILRQGGSAVDATISILLCLGAVQPESNGIGGGGFMLVHTKTSDKVINFRERAPAAASQDMYKADPSLSKIGGLASGVPGEIRGYSHAHTMFGKLPWKDLFTPSIELLKSPIKVSHHLASSIKTKKGQIFTRPILRKMFFNNDTIESYKREGDTFEHVNLAATYQKIADEGPDAFYTGSIAQNIVNAMGTDTAAGIMTMEDLANYTTTLAEPFKFEYRGQTILSAPPPASGHVIALTLQVLDNFDLGSFGPLKAWNYIIEAMRFGYAMRSRTGDPLYSNLTETVVNEVKEKTYVTKLIKEHFKKDSYERLKPYDDYNEYLSPIYTNYDGTHTTHVSVMGPDGEAVACTSTVNLFFGSQIVTDDGIFLNNQMDDFSTPGVKNAFGYDPSPENFIVPHKRPMSSSSPSIVFDNNGEATFVTGAAGGSRIISGTLLSLINALDMKMSLEDNLKSARIHDQLSQKTIYELVPGVTPLEPEIIAGLSGLGYNMSVRYTAMSTVTSVSKLYGKNEASGDPRKNGTGIVIVN